jgi:ankyrin repeat protein
MLSHPDFNAVNCSNAFNSASGHANIVRLLLSDPRFDPSFDSNRTIVEAARNGNTEIVQLLLEDPKVDPADQYNFALIYSVGNGHAEIVKLLLEDPRVNLLEVENTRLIEVAFTGEIEKTRILLEDSENYISKIGEATENVEKILKLLLEYRDGMNDKRVDL